MCAAVRLFTAATAETVECRGNEYRRPLHLVLKIVLVMRIQSLEAAEEGRCCRGYRHVFLETSLARILFPADFFVPWFSPGRWAAQLCRCAGSGRPSLRIIGALQIMRHETKVSADSEQEWGKDRRSHD